MMFYTLKLKMILFSNHYQLMSMNWIIKEVEFPTSTNSRRSYLEYTSPDGKKSII